MRETRRRGSEAGQAAGDRWAKKAWSLPFGAGLRLESHSRMGAAGLTVDTRKVSLVMTTTSDADAGAKLVPIGPPVPFDAELAQFLAAMPPMDFGEVTLEMIPALRQARTGVFPEVTDDDLRRGGAYAVTTRSVPGPAGAPEVSLLICHPAGRSDPAATAVPALYHIHGGGMIMGTNRIGMLAMMDLAAPLGMAVVSVEYRLA